MDHQPVVPIARLRRAAGLLALVLTAGCPSTSDTSQSLYLTIHGSDPVGQNDPQTIMVTVYLETTINYSDARSGLSPHSPASSSTRIDQVSPDALSLTVDGVPLPDFRWDTSAYADGTHVFVATARFGSLSASGTWSWTLDRRPATFQPLEVPPLLDQFSVSGVYHDVAVSFGPGDVPLLLSTQVLDPSSSQAGLCLLRVDGGSWTVANLGSVDSTHPALLVEPSGEVWAAWDENGTVGRVKRSDGGWWEELPSGLPALLLHPRLSLQGASVLIGTADPTAPLRRFEQGSWQPAAPGIGVTPDQLRLAVAPGGTAYLALQRIAGGYDVQVLRTSGGQAWEQVGGDLLVAAWDGGSSQAGHLIDLLVDGDGQPVIAVTGDGSRIEVYRWSGTDWRPLGRPIPFDDDSLGRSFEHPRAQAAMASVPDGGLALLYPSDNGTLRLDAWNGTDWVQLAGPLRAAVGTASVDGPALAYDSAGRPLAAWHQGDFRSQHRLVVWRP